MTKILKYKQLLKLILNDFYAFVIFVRFTLTVEEMPITYLTRTKNPTCVEEIECIDSTCRRLFFNFPYWAFVCRHNQPKKLPALILKINLLFETSRTVKPLLCGSHHQMINEQTSQERHNQLKIDTSEVSKNIKINSTKNLLHFFFLFTKRIVLFILAEKRKSFEITCKGAVSINNGKNSI